MQHAALQAGPRPARRGARVDAPSQVEARYSYRREDHELVLSSLGVSEAMTEAVAGGEAEFALIVEESFLGLCARFGDAIPWVCAFYGWHLSSREEGMAPPDRRRAESRVLLCTSLVDGREKITRAERGITLSLDFSRALLNAIDGQARTPHDPGAARQEMARLRRRCPTPEALAASASVRSRGNP